MSQKQKYIEQLDDLAELHGVEIPTTGTEAELKNRVAEWQAKSLKPVEMEVAQAKPRHSLPRAAATIQFCDKAGDKKFIVKGQPVDVDAETTAALFAEGMLVDPYAEGSDE